MTHNGPHSPEHGRPYNQNEPMVDGSQRRRFELPARSHNSHRNGGREYLCDRFEGGRGNNFSPKPRREQFERLRDHVPTHETQDGLPHFLETRVHVRYAEDWAQ